MPIRGLTWSTICGWVTPHEQFSGICTHSSNSTVRPRFGGTSGSSATFLRPGLAYVGKFFQISTAAGVPLRGYLPRRGVGAVVLFDLFLNKVVLLLVGPRSANIITTMMNTRDLRNTMRAVGS